MNWKINFEKLQLRFYKYNHVNKNLLFMTFLVIYNEYKIYVGLVILYFINFTSKFYLKRFVIFIFQNTHTPPPHRYTHSHVCVCIFLILYSMGLQKWTYKLKLCRVIITTIKREKYNCSVTFKNFVGTLKILLMLV